jgi:hypothetical protein
MVQNIILIYRGVSFWQIPENRMFPYENMIVLNIVLSAAARARDCHEKHSQAFYNPFTVTPQANLHKTTILDDCTWHLNAS